LIQLTRASSAFLSVPFPSLYLRHNGSTLDWCSLGLKKEKGKGKGKGKVAIINGPNWNIRLALTINYLEKVFPPKRIQLSLILKAQAQLHKVILYSVS
jgi:hypothetical protein